MIHPNTMFNVIGTDDQGIVLFKEMHAICVRLLGRWLTGHSLRMRLLD